jgi:hypothetical protein
MKPEWNKTFSQAALMDIDRKYASQCRQEELRAAVRRYRAFSDPMAYLWIKECLEEILWLKEKESMVRVVSKDDITDSDIQAAKDFPIEELVEFNGFGKALAWCHEDSKPSLSLWKGHNRCKCFVCDKMFNPIDIKMTRDGCNFIQAVKELRG